jgi:hypothetical protein
MGRSTQPVLRQSGAFASWPSWAQDAISSLRAKGVNVLFFTASATAPVTRLQVARAITETVLLGKQADPTKVQSFSDTVRLPPEYLRYVNLVSSLGIMTGKAGGTLFDPYGFLNRAEAAKIFGKAIDVRAGR